MSCTAAGGCADEKVVVPQVVVTLVHGGAGEGSAAGQR